MTTDSENIFFALSRIDSELQVIENFLDDGDFVTDEELKLLEKIRKRLNSVTPELGNRTIILPKAG